MKHVSSEALTLATTNRATSCREPQDDRAGFDVRLAQYLSCTPSASYVWLLCVERSSNNRLMVRPRHPNLTLEPSRSKGWPPSVLGVLGLPHWRHSYTVSPNQMVSSGRLSHLSNEMALVEYGEPRTFDPRQTNPDRNVCEHRLQDNFSAQYSVLPEIPHYS